MERRTDLMKSFTVKLEQDENGDLLLPFPDELLTDMGWAEGTELEWKINPDGSVEITEKNNNK